MERFPTNAKYYQSVLDTYTSSDEFNANKRVHYNNEIPPVDLYDMVHSKLKNDMWKWFLGSSSIAYDIPYNIATDALEYFDEDGIIVQPSIAKYVNGVRAPDFGPVPKLTYNPNIKPTYQRMLDRANSITDPYDKQRALDEAANYIKDFYYNERVDDYYEITVPEYHRVQLEGVFLPEVDFLLHEGYRYLSVLYPDHPNFTEILTTNEVNDEIIQAAAVIHYVPDCIFFDWLVTEYEQGVDYYDLPRAFKEEALMMKIRNLTNHAFRRKLYGAKTGYMQFGSEILQHMSVHIVAEYLPFKPYLRIDETIRNNNEHKNFKWYNNIYHKPDILDDRAINKFDTLYRKQFRLLDFDNWSYDYVNTYKDPVEIFGTAYPTPYSMSDIYEYPNTRNTVLQVPMTIMEDFYSGQKVTVSGQPCFINYMIKENAYRVSVNLSYAGDELDDHYCSTYQLIDAITHINITSRIDPIYVDFQIHRGVEHTLQRVLDAEPDTYDMLAFESAVHEPNPLTRSIKELYKLIPDHIDGKFTLNPHQNGTLYMPANQFLTLYADYLNVTIDRTDYEKPVLQFSATAMAEDGYVHQNDLIVNDLVNSTYISEIVGIENGVFKFTVTEADRMFASPTGDRLGLSSIEAINAKEDGEYVLVFEFSKQNLPELTGKKVVLMGKPIFSTTEHPDKDNQYQVNGVTFYVSAIPFVKSHEMLKCLYVSYEQTALDKFKLLETIFKNGSSLKEGHIYKTNYARYEKATNAYATFVPALKTLIAQNKAGQVHPNDTYWNRVKTAATNLIDAYDLAPVKQRQLREYYNDFVATNDSTAALRDPDKIEANCLALYDMFEEYNSVYFPLLFCEISIDLDREYYTSYRSSNDETRRTLNAIERLDVVLDTMLPNRNLLLKPATNDFYNVNLTEEFAYSPLVQLDTLSNVLSIHLDKYGEGITHTKVLELGTDGLLNEYTFGSLNTASISSNNEDVKLDDPQYYYSNGKEYIERYYLGTQEYLCLNKDISFAINASSEPKKFSYATIDFLDLFMPDDKVNNVVGVVQQTHEVEIRSICTAGSNIIDFVDEESIWRMAALSTGDQVIGKTIENDTFIEVINIDNHYVTLNKALHTSGDFVLTYLCKINIFAKDVYVDFFKYRYELSRNKLIDTGSVVSHIFNKERYDCWPSETYPMSAVDVSKFKENLLRNLRNQSIYKQFFNRHVWDLHNDGIDPTAGYTMSSVIHVNQGLFLEANAFKTFKETNPAKKAMLTDPLGVFGFTNDREYIMKKEVLDYFQNYLYELSRASDNVNVGVAITASTKADGEPTIDPKIDSVFTTYGWNFNTVPYYVDIGVGKLDDVLIQKMEFEDQQLDYEDKSYWNYSIYDDIHMTKDRDERWQHETDNMSYEELREQGIDLEKADRSVWFAKQFTVKDGDGIPPIYSIHRPIMRAYIGEYEVQKFIKFDGYLEKNFTTVQFSIIKQVFKNLKKDNEVPLNVVNKRFFELNILRNVIVNNKKDLDTDTDLIRDGQEITSIYLGEWRPGSRLVGGQYYINWPAIPVDMTPNRIYYYSIAEHIQLVSVIDDVKFEEKTGVLPNIAFEAGTIIVVENGRWQVKDFVFAGLYGTSSELNKIIIPPNDDDTFVNISNSYPIEKRDDGAEYTLLHMLLVKLLINLGLFKGNLQNVCEYTVEQLEEMYQNVLDYRDTEFDDDGNIIHQENIEAIKTEILGSGYIENSPTALLFPETFKNKYNVNTHNIYWFMYTKGRDAQYGLLERCQIMPGQCIALLYVNNKFRISLLNENKLLFLINSDKKIRINTEEYLTFIGQYGYTEKRNIFLFEKVDQYVNTLDLRYKNLLRGSVDVNITAVPHFKVDGWEYNNDGITLKDEIRKNPFDITEDNIYYDSINNKLYSYNTDSKTHEKTKFAIVQEDNKYFKNLLYIYGQYQQLGATINKEFVEQGVLTPIPGVPFNVDNASLFDRILEIEQINIRSQYNINLEPTLFSSYCNIEGILKGIHVTEDGNKYLSVNYKYDKEPILTTNKLKFSTEVQKLLPIRNGLNWASEDIDFTNAKWPDGEKVDPPLVQSVKVTKSITADNDESTLKYYKNLLVLEGEVDTAQPNKIDFSRNTKLQDALSYVKRGDSIVDIVGISSLSSKSYNRYVVSATKNLNAIKFVDYRNNILIIATNTGLGAVYKRTLDGLEDTIYVEDKNIVNYEFPGPLNTKYIYNQLNSLSWDEKKGIWILGVSNGVYESNTLESELLSVTISTNETDITDIRLAKIYDSPGQNINAYQFVAILDKDTGDDRKNNYKTVLTRDVAFQEISISGNIDVITNNLLNSINIDNSDYRNWESKELNPDTGLNYTSLDPLPDPNYNYRGFGFNKSGEYISKTPIIIEKDSYKILNFTIKKVNPAISNSSSISIGVDNKDIGYTEFENKIVIIDQIWIFDKEVQKWVVTLNSEDFPNFISNYNNTEYTNVTTYLVGSEFGKNKHDVAGEFLWKLPRAEVSENTIVAAIVCTEDVNEVDKLKPHSINLKITISDDGGQFNIYNLTVNSPEKIIYNYDVSDPPSEINIRHLQPETYIEGPYNPLIYNNEINYIPYLVENVNDKLRAKKWSVYNSLGHQAIIIGSTIFFYTPTNYYGEETDLDFDEIRTTFDPAYFTEDIINKGKDALNPIGLTEEYHWKRAELPSSINNTYQLFNEMTLKQAYELVLLQRELTLDEISKLLNQTRPPISLPISDGTYAISLSDPEEHRVYKAMYNWIILHNVQFYENDEVIPIEIREPGIQFYKTEKGNIPQFYTDYNKDEKDAPHVKWTSAQETKFELGNIVSVYLTHQMYLRYLADYYSVICGATRYVHYFGPEELKDVQLTNTQLIIQTANDDIISFPIEKATSRDAIENYNNWHVSNIAPEYIFIDQRATYEQRTVCYDNKYYNLKSFPTQKTTKAFTLLEKYIENNIQIYAGYIEANDNVRDIYNEFIKSGPNNETILNNFKYIIDLFPNRLGPNNIIPSFTEEDPLIVFNRKYPIIFYSVNNGQSFTKTFIPKNEILIENIFNYEKEETNILLKDRWCEAIYRLGNKIRIHYKKDSDSTQKELPIGYTTFTINEQEGNSLLVFDNENYEFNLPIEKIDLYESLSYTWKNFKIGPLNGTIEYNSFGLDSGFMSSSVFCLEQPYHLTLNGQQITEVSSNYLLYNNAPNAVENSEALRVLVSIDQSNLLENPTKYLDYKNEYLDSTSKLLVEYILPVTELRQANRLYSPREVMLPNDKQDNLKYGIPAISEDIDHNTYQYYEPYRDSKGNLIYKYKEATNLANQTIYLCQSNGDYIIELDPTTMTNRLRLKTLIEENIDYQTLIPAPILLESFKAEIINEEMTIQLNSYLNNRQIQYINFDRLFSDLQINIEIINEFILDLIDKNLLYKWPTTAIDSLDDMWKLNETGENRYYNYKSDDCIDILQYLLSIENKEGPFNDDKKISNRIAAIEIEKDGNKEYYIFDRLTSTIPIKENDNIYLNISVPYEFANGQTIYDNVIFQWNKNEEKKRIDISPYEENQELNGIYLKSNGYGGYIYNDIYNKNFYLERPEHIDYQAFEHELVTNKYDEFIYLVDEYGNRINSKNGLFWLTTINNVHINYDNLLQKENIIKLYGTDDITVEPTKDFYNYIPVEYNIYKLEQSKIDVYTPKNTIWFNSLPMRNSTNYEEDFYDKTDNVHQILLSVMKINKAGVSIDLKILEENYCFEFKDYLGETIIFGGDPYNKIKYDKEKEQLLYLYKGEHKKENIPPIDKLYIHITDENKQKQIYELNIAPWTIKNIYNEDVDNREKGKILNITPIKYNTIKTEIVQWGTNKTEITFDGQTFEPNEYFVSIDYTEQFFVKSYYMMNDYEYSRPENYKISLGSENYNEAIRGLYIDNYQTNLDLRVHELELFTNRSWVINYNDLSKIEYFVYSKDQEINIKSLISINELKDKKNETWPFKVDLGESCELEVFLKEIKQPLIKEIKLDTWVYRKKPEEKDCLFNHKTQIIVDGLYGNILLNKPKYDNFKDLLDKKDNIIEYKNRKIIQQYIKGEKDNNEIIEIASNFSNMKLKDLVKDPSLNDGSKYFLKMKILPLNTIYTQLKNLNDVENYVYEIESTDIPLFGFDRIYINEQAYVPPPIVRSNVMYNKESLELYYENEWLNKDGYKIFLCDEKGRFVETEIRNYRLTYKILGESDGDCRGVIYGNVDPRINILEPMYKSSIDWFKSEFYIEGKEINPFLITINIRDLFDEKLKDFRQQISLTIPKKLGDIFIQQPVEDSYLTSIFNSFEYRYDFMENILIQNSKLDFIDYENGTVKLLIKGPPDNYQFETHKFLYGIKYTNTFSYVNDYRDIWVDKTQLHNKIDLSFYLNTRENILDKQNKEYGVVDITEMGLFNRKGELVAYLTHPIAQYRSDTQHISYNLLIEES